MAYVKRIVCLANSNKNGGNCVAGREMLADSNYGAWIRPVSARPTAEISFMESLYLNNQSPKLLDVIDVPLKRPAPHLHQTENHEIDPLRPWIRIGKLAWNEVPRLCDRPSNIWPESSPAQCGSNNCISSEQAANYTNSLLFIRTRQVVLQACPTQRANASRLSHKAIFVHNGVEYRLTLTDPVAISAIAKASKRGLDLDDVFLCVSLTEPWPADKSRCHKLVAAVIRNPPL
jgi:hypothetical protein